MPNSLGGIHQVTDRCVHGFDMLLDIVKQDIAAYFAAGGAQAGQEPPPSILALLGERQRQAKRISTERKKRETRERRQKERYAQSIADH
jgi:hypothetical protein